MPYATRDEVLQRLNLTGNASSDLTSRIDDALAAATTEIENDTSRVFTQSDGAVRVLRVPNRYTDTIDVPDLRSVVSLKVDDTDDGTFETTITAYELDMWIDRDGWPYDRIRLLNRYWPCGGNRRRRIELTANFGWEAIPPTINQACSLLASRMAQKPSHALFGVQGFGESGTQSIQKDHDYWRMIQPYCLIAVA